MAAMKLLAKLVLYYGAVGVILAAVLWLWPDWRENLPIGRVQALIAQAGAAGAGANSLSGLHATPALAFAPSLVWLAAAVFGALLAAFPVSWVYMEIRDPGDYDQSLIDTIVVLPLVVTSIVVVVQHSLALSFSLAGIAGAARYRNSLKSSGDLLFILLAIALGLSAGIGALELALVTSAAFNLCFVFLWSTNYGEREKMKRFMSGYEHPHGNGNGNHQGKHKHANAEVISETTTITTVATEVTETVEVKPKPPQAEPY